MCKCYHFAFKINFAENFMTFVENICESSFHQINNLLLKAIENFELIKLTPMFIEFIR